jgi:formamidopyrimidine-DNA glycosylase
VPELPEVEIHARNLRGWLVGKRIAEAQVLDPMLDAENGGAGWAAPVSGRRVQAVRRDAKYLLIDLDEADTLVAHLRMTGRFRSVGYRAAPPEKWVRMVLALEDGTEVQFEDRRRFGRVWLAPTAAVRSLPELAELGPDALEAPTSAGRLTELAAMTSRSIKVLLMDQRLIGGIGNICAAEILYRARIAPDRPARSLTAEEVERIAQTIPPYLEWAIAVQSRRELIYLGEKGAENVFTVYRREGEPCPECATPIARSVIAGRGTYYCPGCQPSRGEG